MFPCGSLEKIRIDSLTFVCAVLLLSPGFGSAGSVPSEHFLLSVGDTKPISVRNSSATDGRQQVADITFKFMGFFYDISVLYEFVVPRVTIECDCLRNGRQQSRGRDMNCPLVANETTTCTSFTLSFKSPSISACCNDDRELCRAFFSADKTSQTFYAVRLLNPRVLYYFQISTPTKKYKVFCRPNVHPLKVETAPFVLELHSLSPNVVFPEEFYYVTQKWDAIRTVPDMNIKGEMDLTKVGWFQRSNGTLKHLLSESLERSIRFRNVDRSFELHLNASNFIDDHGKLVGDDSRNLEHVYEEEFDFKLHQSPITPFLLVVPKNPKSVHVLVGDESSACSFSATISFINMTFYIDMMFNSGTGIFHVTIGFPEYNEKEMFLLTIPEASKVRPYFFSRKLQMQPSHRTMVCVVQDRSEGSGGCCLYTSITEERPVYETKVNKVTLSHLPEDIPPEDYVEEDVASEVFLTEELGEIPVEENFLDSSSTDGTLPEGTVLHNDTLRIHSSDSAKTVFDNQATSNSILIITLVVVISFVVLLAFGGLLCRKSWRENQRMKTEMGECNVNYARTSTNHLPDESGNPCLQSAE